jgi:ferredoxin
MSDNTERFPENVPGKYYVAKTCIGCALCSEIAPENFAENLEEDLFIGNNYVCRQPDSEEAESLCKEAMDHCPASAIRDDGTV